jgi:hypothetical protein
MLVDVVKSSCRFSNTKLIIIDYIVESQIVSKPSIHNAVKNLADCTGGSTIWGLI